jgi:diadenosine tetraphosphate (Ap4A) HIT family hydrolase
LDFSCPFCHVPADRVVLKSELAVVVRDGFPVSPGHTLIIPHRHIASFVELTEAERVDLMSLLATARDGLERTFRPDGYNIGINDGPAAGQTVPHLHVHLIPRYNGDREDPRGGVRWVLPDKAAYWNQS